MPERISVGINEASSQAVPFFQAAPGAAGTVVLRWQAKKKARSGDRHIGEARACTQKRALSKFSLHT
jgi:hypothetical protein